ncbi:MAG: type VI-C CRISPR-associated RNA-guided ribonuclease Cas13c [Cetobacterium sp.]|nr:type VI-C CRISPR-associated RNA-guided ribonuclease Cas13c [Cetobacterium sp.]
MKKIKNKSSIIRVIISNFDSKEMKEFKILYTKQGGVDTFLTSTEFGSDGKLIFKSIKNKVRDKNLYKVTAKILESGNKVHIDKYDIRKGQLIRTYEVEGTYENTNNNGKKIILKVEDKNQKNVHDPRGIRRIESKTERLLLSEDIREKYSKIALCPIEEIDSKKLYKIKKFFNYRSNMLIYFNFINDFLTKETGEKELWEIKDTCENVEIIFENIKKYLSIGIENYNNYVNNLNKKLSEDEKELEIKQLTDDELREDIKKILKLFGDFRHKLMHYDYKFFERLFDNEKINVYEESLKEILNLNIFKIISLLKTQRRENKTNYITKEDKLSVLGKCKKAKTLYEIYWGICDRKNGFNKFINGFFTKDGVEDQDFKEIIGKDFEQKYLKMEEKEKYKKENFRDKKNNPGDYQKLMKKIYEFKENYKDIFYWDINDCPEYKKLYSRRKELIEKYNKQINGIKDKKYITDLNKQLLKLKVDMEKITKANSLIRLGYKLQVAYGFLMKEYKLDINKFKNNFKPSEIKDIENYYKKREEYLSADISQEKIEFNLKNLEKSLNKAYKDSFEEINEKNLSMKFYMLVYILLPTEIRGDFLGFIKKYYYDIKNVDFIDENIGKEELESLLEKETFFHDIRLFEKNIKHYQLINYELIEFYDLKEQIGEYLESLGIQNWKSQTYRNSSDRNIFGKNIILPIFKFYENIFKLLNDIELHSIFYLINKKSWGSIEEAIININNNFMKGIKEIASSKRIPKVATEFQIRNDIAHMTYYNTLENILFETDLDFYSHLTGEQIKKLGEKRIMQIEDKKIESINERIDSIINNSEVSKILNVDLGFNFINDYYMRKEKFIFNQRGLEKEYILSPNQEEAKRKEKEILDFYKLDISKVSDLNKLYNYAKDLLEGEYKSNKELWRLIKNKEIIINKQEKMPLSFYTNPTEEQMDKINKFIYREGSQLLGLYKKSMGRKIKESLIKKFTKNEYKYIKVIITDKKSSEKNKNKEYTVILKRKDISEKFIILDEKNLNDKEGFKRKNIIKEIEIVTEDNEKFYLNNKADSQDKRLIVDFMKKFTEEEDDKIFVPGKYFYKIKEIIN